MLHTTNLDIIIVCTYLCFLVLVGVFFSRFSKNSSDYFKAGGRGTWYLVGASLFMSGISTYTFVGNASGIYKSGWSPIAIYSANVLALILGALFMGAWYRQMRLITFAEAIRERFNVATEQVVSVLLIINNLIWAGAVLYGLSVFSTFLFPNVPSVVLIACVGAVVVIYSAIGGNWAVMANDFVQGLVMVSITILIAILCFVEVGGIGAFFDAIKSSSAASDLQLLTPAKEGQDWINAEYGLSWAIAAFIVQFLQVISIFNGVRFFSAKDGREAAKASLLSAGLMTLGCILFFVPPIYARLFLNAEVMAMNPDPSRAPEFSYAITSFKLLPNGGFSLLIVAMFAAAISSLDTALNRNAAVLVRNVAPLINRIAGRKQFSDHQEVLAGKVMTVVLGFAVVVIAMIYANIKGVTLFDLFLDLSATFMLPVLAPLVYVLFFRKVPVWAALASMGGGLVPGMIDVFIDTGWTYQVKSFYVLSGGSSVYFLSMFFYKGVPQPTKEKWNTFYDQMETPVDFEKEVGHANDGEQLVQIGKFAVVLGSLIGLLMILENPLWGRLCILGITTFVAGIGSAMWIAGHKMSKRIIQST
jgi:Na+/proline symporter